MNHNMLTFVNGSPSNAVDANNRGLAFGDGVFETIRVENGCPPLLTYHLNRLADGLDRLHIHYDKTELNHSIERFFQAVSLLENATGKAKLIITRGQGGKGYHTQASAAFESMFSFTPVSVEGWVQPSKELIRGKCAVSSNPHLAGLKHLNRLDYVMAALKTPCKFNQEILIHNASHKLIEALHHNVFVINDNAIITPHLDDAGVEGVMKHILHKHVFPLCNLTLHHAHISYDDIKKADAVFISNAMTGITPAAAFEGNVFMPNSILNQIGLTLTTFMQNRLP